MNVHKAYEVLIATVGAEPQVVTLVLDSLFLNSHIKEVVLIYTEYPGVLDSVNRIDREIHSKCYHDLELTKFLITGDDGTIEDFYSSDDISVLLKNFYGVIKEYKQKGAIIHLCINGGRKVMAIMGMVAAQFLFGPEDRVWYLITKGWKPGASNEMHLSTNNKCTLVEIPVLRWEESSLLLGMAEFATPMELIHWQKNISKNKKMRRRKEFVEHWLTKAEREVVKLVCQGWDNATVAKYLNKQERTVANQLTSIYEKLNEWLDFPDGRIDRSLMIAELVPYFVLANEGK